jgi:hypothetical protein
MLISKLFKSLELSLVSVENALLLWFNTTVLRLYAPIVLLVFEMKGWFRRNLIGEQAINYAIYY